MFRDRGIVFILLLVLWQPSLSTSNGPIHHITPDSHSTSDNDDDVPRIEAKTIADFEEADEDEMRGVIFLAQSEKCDDERSIVEAIDDHIPRHQAASLSSQLHRVTSLHRRRRLGADDDTNINNDIINIVAFKQLSIEDRRDQAIAALDILFAPSSSSSSDFLAASSSSSPATIVKRHLDGIKVDVIHNVDRPTRSSRSTADDSTDHSQLYKIAAAIPCLSYEPEYNYMRYPTQQLVTSNDPRANTQWHLFRSTAYPYGANIHAAWRLYRGETQPPVVAVVDTGCSFHPDLDGGCIPEINPACGAAQVPKLCTPNEDCAGADYGEGDNNPYKEPVSSVHGTPVSGMIGGISNNSFSMAGVCWGCRIMCLKIANSRGGLAGDAQLAAINHLYKKASIVRISNHSYVGYGKSSAEENAIRALRNVGHLFVAAAGNDKCDIDPNPTGTKCPGSTTGNIKIAVPAGYDLDNILSVGSNNADGSRSSFSNWGRTNVDLMAPGNDVPLIYNTRAAKSGETVISGTSFSSPLMAGVAALIWGSRPQLTYLQVKEAIMKTVFSSSQLGGMSITEGVVDAGAALTYANGGQDGATPAVYPKPTVDLTNWFYGGGASLSYGVVLSAVVTLMFCFI